MSLLYTDPILEDTNEAKGTRYPVDPQFLRHDLERQGLWLVALRLREEQAGRRFLVDEQHRLGQ